MNKKTGMIALVLSALALILACAALFVASGSRAAAPAAPAPAEGDIQYVLYLGTNDKDSNDPVFTPEEAKEQAKKILVDHFGGYTIQEASGGWLDGETMYQEYTLVIYLSDTDLEQVHAAADEMIRVFRQSSVLIQANRTVTEFYGGNG